MLDGVHQDVAQDALDPAPVHLGEAAGRGQPELEVAAAALGVWLVAEMRRRRRAPLARGVALALCVANPLTLNALEIGHPEELLGGALCVAAVLLAAGTKGKRMALPNSRILIHQPATEGGYGQSTDMEIQAREILRMRTAMELILARHTGQSEDKVRRDIERDKFLTAEEAKDYGIIDDVLTMIKRGSERAVEVVSSLPGGFSSSLLGRAAV